MLTHSRRSRVARFWAALAALVVVPATLAVSTSSAGAAGSNTLTVKAGEYTYQLKGSDAHIVPGTDADMAAVRRYRHAFVRQLEQMGYPADLLYAFLNCPDSDIVAIVFTPTSAFFQTPGPKAGQPLGSQA